jgi:hypothetical protein
VRTRPGPTGPGRTRRPGRTAREPETPREAAGRARVLRAMASIRRPVTGGEILSYFLTSWSAAGVRDLMQRIADDGIVTFTEADHPNAIGRRARSYRLAGGPTEGGAP